METEICEAKPEGRKGVFYTADTQLLGEEMDQYEASHSSYLENITAIFVPHAGHVYSGEIAAAAFAQLRQKSFRRIFLLADNHQPRMQLTGIALPPFRGFRILNKTLPIDLPTLEKLRRKFPEICHFSASAFDTHIMEVQLPFLEHFVGEKTPLIPLIFMGNSSENLRKFTDWMGENLNPADLLVVSSDLSHYLSNSQAMAKDRQTLTRLLANDRRKLPENSLCGPESTACLMEIAAQKNWEAYFLDYSHSGKINRNLKNVVGYGAIAWRDRPLEIAAEAWCALRQFAKDCICAALQKQPLPRETSLLERYPLFRAHRGVFVTLQKFNTLRGCVGSIDDFSNSILQGVRQWAVDAALNDPRFSPLTCDELSTIEIHISILSFPHRIEKSPVQFVDFLENQSHKPGVILEIGGEKSTFLPEVWQQIPRTIPFLNALAEKQGKTADAWRREDAQFAIYHTLCS